MRQNRDCQWLEVFGRAVVAAVEEGHGLGGVVEHLRSTGRHTQRKMIGLARLSDDCQRIRDERFVHVNLTHGVLDFENVGGVEHGPQLFELRRAGFRPQNFSLCIAFGIAHAHSHQETVEL